MSVAPSTDILNFNPVSPNIRALRASLRCITSENDKLKACIAIQNEMHFQRKQSEWLFAKLEQVMMEECNHYRENKQSQIDVDPDAEQWERFIDIAQSNIKMSKQCLAPLARTAESWGISKVQYYEWASMGRKYCHVLGAAASQTPIWEEALIKLNQLLLRRITEGRSLRMSTNPLYLLDLERLVAWSGKADFEKRGRRAYILKYESICEADLPNGYELDQFGLIAATPSQFPVSPCAKVVSKPLQYLRESEDKAAITTSATSIVQAYQVYSRSWKLLQVLMLLWCLLLAVLSWSYRRL